MICQIQRYSHVRWLLHVYCVMKKVKCAVIILSNQCYSRTAFCIQVMHLSRKYLDKYSTCPTDWKSVENIHFNAHLCEISSKLNVIYNLGFQISSLDTRYGQIGVGGTSGGAALLNSKGHIIWKTTPLHHNRLVRPTQKLRGFPFAILGVYVFFGS